MSTADRPAPPPDDLLRELHAHDREFRSINEASDALGERRRLHGLRSRELAQQMRRAGVESVIVDSWHVWPDRAGTGLHRKRLPSPVQGAASHA